MTREELAKILEEFAVLVLKTSMTGIDPGFQYELITSGIDTITETVMFCSDRNRLTTPSTN